MGFIRAAKRAVLLVEVLRGGFDKETGYVEVIADLRRRSKELTRLLIVQQEQTGYYCSLWLQAGKEHAAAQAHMVELIDDLRRELGKFDGKSFLEHQMKDSYEKKHVGDKDHQITHPIEGAEIPASGPVVFPPVEPGTGVPELPEEEV